MSVEYAEKIHGLLSHEDIEVVQQGLALLDSLVDSEAELRTYIPYPQDCSDVETLHDFLKGLEWKHHNRIKVWVLECLARFQVQWVLEIARLDLSDCGLETLPDFIVELNALTELNISKNPLENLPEALIYKERMFSTVVQTWTVDFPLIIYTGYLNRGFRCKHILWQLDSLKAHPGLQIFILSTFWVFLSKSIKHNKPAFSI